MANIISTTDPLYGQVVKPLTTALTSSTLYEPPTNTFINYPGGDTGQVQFNYSGSFKGDNSFYYNPATKMLILRGIMYAEEFRGQITTNLNNFKLEGGSNGQVLATDGQGNLIFSSIGTQVNVDWLSTSGITQILNKPNLDNYSTTTQVNTSISQAIANIPAPNLSAYATLTFVTNSINSSIANIPAPNLNGYATTTYVNQQIANIPGANLSGYATQTYVNQQIANIPGVNLTSYATKLDLLDDVTAINNNLSTNYATKTYVTNAISNLQSQLTTYINNQIANVSVDLTGYATLQDIQNILDGLNTNIDGGSASTSINTTTMILNGGGA